MRAAERFQRRASIWHHYSLAPPRQDGHISGKSIIHRARPAFTVAPGTMLPVFDLATAGVMLTDWSERLSPTSEQSNRYCYQKQRCEAGGSFVMKPLRGAYMERETGVEPATSTLARSRSTTELLPLNLQDYK